LWGFIALVQTDTAPLDPSKWVVTTSADGGQHWLRLASPAGSRTEKALEAAVGPLASLLATVGCLVLAYRSKNPLLRQMALMLALLIAFVMAMYYLRSPLRTGGDEADLAMQLGVSRLWVELPFAAAFVICLVYGLRPLSSWRERGKWLGAAFAGSLMTGLLVNVADGLVRTQVDLGNPLFRPLLGVSLPVLITYVVVILLVGVFWLVLSKSPIPAKD
jgi:drug/metabolite transporter (DMT)-like permease